MLIVVVIYRYNFAEQQVTKKFSDVEQFSYSWVCKLVEQLFRL